MTQPPDRTLPLGPGDSPRESKTLPLDPAGPAGRGGTGTDDGLIEELRAALAPRIQLVRQLGAGGMGVVWLAREPALRRDVAVKVMLPELADDPTARKRFEREAEAAAAVSHPGVVNVYQVGELPRSGTVYFVMQFVEGHSLAEEIVPGQALPEARVRRVVGEIAAALGAAHARGLVHRDIKPVNVMVEHGSGRIVVLDFGISAAIQQAADPVSRLTTEGVSIGTPTYMSPEQAAGRAEITEKSDVYSLGVVAFELATGRPPFSGTTPWELVAAHIKEAPPKLGSFRPDLDPRLAGLVDDCLDKAPERRPAAADIARALVPEANAVIEWPPPGLEPLRGAGVVAATKGGETAGVALLFFLLLRTTPILVQPTWYVERYMAFDGTVAWYAVLGLCLAAITASLVPLGWRGWQLVALVRAGRRAGYPYGTLLDVAWDSAPDTGPLLNGVGPWALVPGTERAAVLAGRRRQALFVAATIVVSLASPLAWFLGWTGGWAGDRGVVLPGLEVLVLFLPPLVGMVCIALSGRREAALRARLSLTPVRTAPPPVRPELVAAWLSSAGLAAGPGPDAAAPGRGRAVAARIGRAAAAVVPALLAVAVFVAATIVLGVALEAGGTLGTARQRAREVTRLLATDTLRPLAWPVLDSLLTATARRAGGGGAAADSARAAIAAGERDLSQVTGSWQRGRSEATSGAHRLAAAGTAARAPAVADAGAHLAATLSRWFATLVPLTGDAGWPRALAADPSAAAIRPYLADRRLAPFVRARFAGGIVGGLCMNTREVLFGPARERAAALDSVAAALADLPGASGLLQGYRRDLAALGNGAGMPGRVPGFLRPIGWVGLRGLRNRLAYCLRSPA